MIKFPDTRKAIVFPLPPVPLDKTLLPAPSLGDKSDMHGFLPYRVNAKPKFRLSVRLEAPILRLP